MKRLACALVLAGLATTAQADVVAAAPDHYVLRHEATSSLAPAAMWQRLVHPETWWSPDHSYSGDAANLALAPVAGGLWTETWDGGSVAHGQVLTVLEGELLRLDAPFGPLQALGVTVVWTITIAPDGDGSKVTFDEVANGTAASGLADLAPAVDAVKAQAMARLTHTD
ncbi:SRPBCC family protein [Hyphomonas johnsonii]|uniref:Polyketide cyclase/dehydrase n=1 Tax=Hyphomonas johnsonii MHS-2 TaxID=1280950 RepID=A0A059FQ20_9PROT|nr:hypothetical protein [Hyphomonas johnsonii]KCZ92722.1 hypothetical protein HJO_07202 [Hyphomonas johnsonii MHS-2]